MEKTLSQIVDRILQLDETELTRLLPEYKRIMDDFQPTKEWEKAVITYFVINAVRVKNTLFNDHIEKQNAKGKPHLKLVKPE
jgi:hypothetical protein